MMCAMAVVAATASFFSDATASSEIYTLSLHDALPISPARRRRARRPQAHPVQSAHPLHAPQRRSEEHTSELQSRPHLVCRLLLEKKKTLRSGPTSPARPTTSSPTTTPLRTSTTPRWQA